MPPNTSSRSNTTLLIGLMLTVLFLLGAAVGVFVWLESQPKVIGSGHGWALYPSREGDAADGDSSQEALAYGGNVKLMTVLYSEQMSKGEGRQIREALCHVLIDLPPEGVLTVRGGGSAGTGEIYRRLNFRIRGQDDSGIPEKELELRFDTKLRVLVLQERLLEMRPNERQGTEQVRVDKARHGPLGTAGGNMFLVRLDDNFDVVEVIPLNETISTRLDDGTVSSLIEKAGTGD